jgi:uncharacterized protein (TIGR03437 family)
VARLTLSVTGTHTPTLDKTSLSFAPGGADQTVTLTLPGATPAPGIYEGALTISGGATTVRVPYVYVVGDGLVNDMIPLIGGGFDGPAGAALDGGLGFKIVDQYGVSVPNASVQFMAGTGASITSQDSQTDNHGVATAQVVLSSVPGTQAFLAQAGGLQMRFSGVGRARPAITAGGAVNAASFQVGAGVVPGSYLSLFGTSLSDTSAGAASLPLPLAISETSVSFEVPSAGISLPGRLLYADSGQVNVQVPWELSGQTSIQIRVNVGPTTGVIYNAPVAPYSPAIFETSQQLAAALDESNNLITSANRVARGRAVQLFANGLGAVSNTPQTGVGASATTLSRTTNQVTVTVGGKNAKVDFAGLAPGFPGLNQVNFVVPADAPIGPQPVVVTEGTVSSPAVNIYVK